MRRSGKKKGGKVATGPPPGGRTWQLPLRVFLQDLDDFGSVLVQLVFCHAVDLQEDFGV